jgi:hypothetical protein
MVVNAAAYGAMVLLGIIVGAHAYRRGGHRAVYGATALFVVLQVVITTIRAALS